METTVYSLTQFLAVDVATWGERLKQHHLKCMHEVACYSQRKAWFDCFNILREQITLLNLSDDILDGSFIIFEYELPRERGRRPDVIIISGTNLLVLEFKGYGSEDQSQIDQAKHYARDLKSYHAESHKLRVIPFLVLAGGSSIQRSKEGVGIVSGENLHKVLKPHISEAFSNIETWYKSEYAPLPSLIQSAKLLFKKGHFPQIKRSKSAGIPETLNRLGALMKQAKNDQNHHLALITGVPGAGKTLVGLQYVFETTQHKEGQDAVFLSGNGPLVRVLQNSLRNRNFVQSVHGFLKQYAHSTQVPREDVIIYDEAQRAWDAEKVSNSRRDGNNSEPSDFINIGNKKTHCLLIALIGEGQEIYLGEEGGLQLWQEAVSNSSLNWHIHCPQHIKDIFPNNEVNIVDSFNLSTSLRTHQALTLQGWVQALLENKIDQARNMSSSLFEEGYPLYITRNLDEAKNYLQKRYENEPNKTYGLIASSKNQILHHYGVPNDYRSTKSFGVEQYYVEAFNPYYCRTFKGVVTEFACQGLELDMPLLAWDTDWIYKNNWMNKTTMKGAKDPDLLRMNSYRVLLTRGRDGIVIYIPEHKELDQTYQVLINSGCRPL
ncbi:DNA/RNA helicase domain-containing protein [Marinilabilia rubra]|uniref:Schlafen group 3-like DNA/RNA helicase domain-containing protein n=1 Tax=Marinilabilia rubra TaxID=2162893 RepID=A0A2U2B6W2_9BACT|nr:DNA/RNA helicase domain-containing protein [Marinilabilia rubra]PWD98782.1 hypothetical protein DDZ16_13670 [Marinilabilia rubra]